MKPIDELIAAVREAVTNGSWSGGGDGVGEWRITPEVYEDLRAALERVEIDRADDGHDPFDLEMPFAENH